MPVSRQKPEDAEMGVSPPLNGHTLDRTLRRYKKYHRRCEVIRKNGTSFEINRERQRTEMLNRKYFDNLRQQQALSGRIDEPRSAKEQPGSAHGETDAAATGFDSSKIKLSPSKSVMDHSSRIGGEDVLGTDQTNGSGGAGSLPSNSLNGFDEVLIKTEPGSGGSTPACVQSPPLSGGSTAGSKAPPNSLTFAPSASSSSSSSSSAAMTSSNGRVGRGFSTPDAKRKCRGSNSRSSPLLEDENDLKLKPYDFLNNVIKTPPIKPLEEGDDPPVTPSPTSVGPLMRRSASNPPTNNSCASNHSNSNQSNPPSTPTGNGIGNNTSTSSTSQMAEDLNEFYRVMEQVYEKGRLSGAPVGNSVATATISTSEGATSTQIDMYGSMSPPPRVVESGTAGGGPGQRIISPPPYNAAPTGALQQTLPAGGPGSYGGTGQQLQRHVALTSPPTLAVSPPFTAADAHRLYSRPHVVQQTHAPPSSLNLQQPQAHAYPSAGTRGSLPSSQVQFSANPSTLQSQSQHRQPSLPTAQQQAQQQAQGVGKPMETQLPRPCLPSQQQQQQHQSMQLSHLNQELVSCPGGAPPTPLTNPITSHMYYNGVQSQRMYTSAPLSLPPHPTPAPPQQQTPLTPTTPLEHFSSPAFQTSQTSRVSPTHCPTNPLIHQSLTGGLTSYTFSSGTSHFLSNHVQTQCVPRHQQQPMRVPQQLQHSGGSLTVSTNSWAGAGGHCQPALPNMMAAPHPNAAMMSRGQVSFLPPRTQVPGQASVSMSSYPLHQRMAHLSSLQHHTVPSLPPAYLQSCGSSTHPGNPAAFSGLPFP